MDGTQVRFKSWVTERIQIIQSSANGSTKPTLRPRRSDVSARYNCNNELILLKEEIVFRNLDPATYFEDGKRKTGKFFFFHFMFFYFPL